MKALLPNGIEIEYEIHGQNNSESVLMIQGLSMQLIDWPVELVSELSKDYRVIVFDNRDIGLSTKYDSIDIDEHRNSTGFFNKELTQPPYSLYDMANDALGLMDCLQIEKFNLIGFSMGGMIAQIIAATSQDRVLRLVSLMSSGGKENVIHSDKARNAMEISAQNVDIDEARKNLIEASFIYAGTNHNICIDEQIEYINIALNRNHHPDGIYRQGLAAKNSGDRRLLLKKIQAPTLIVHGDQDPCIALEHALEANNLINGSRIIVIEGQGHDFPTAIVPNIASHIVSHLSQSI